MARTRMSRRRPRERSPAFWRGAIGVMVTSVLGLFAIVAFNRPPATDPITACRSDGRDPAHTILLVDQSDPFNPNDLGWVQAFMNEEARLLPKYGRLSLITPRSDDPYSPALVFSRCSPGSEDDANPIFSNPQMIADAWRTRFLEPLQAEMDTVLETSTQPNSPLAEAIYAVADRADFQGKTPARRLVVISDLMQHSDAFSFYRIGADYDAFLDTRLSEESPAMDGVSVVARIVPRQQYDLPLADLKTFWGAYFRRAGAGWETVN